ncbi:hypothetical protein, partial [Prevotella brunnea]|uniref:hypothetical protein n=2 Tax=Prevotella TaxID=838 RepID=UPI00283A8ECD
LSYPSMLFGGFAPPAARQTSAVFFIVIAPTEILHFYLELAVSDNYSAMGQDYVTFLQWQDGINGIKL